MDFLKYSLSLHELAAWISAILIFVSSFRYIHSIINGKTKPNIVWWLLYQLATICVLITSYELGSMSTISASLAYAINQLIIIVLAFKYGYAHVNRIEWVYFWISLLSLILWAVFAHSPEIAKAYHMDEYSVTVTVLVTNTLIDLMWAIAIFTKLYKEPETEDSLAWFIAFISWIFSFIAVQNYTIHDLIYPMYLIFSNLAIWLLCFRKKPRQRFKVFFDKMELLVWKWRR